MGRVVQHISCITLVSIRYRSHFKHLLSEFRCQLYDQGTDRRRNVVILTCIFPNTEIGDLQTVQFKCFFLPNKTMDFLVKIIPVLAKEEGIKAESFEFSVVRQIEVHFNEPADQLF